MGFNGSGGRARWQHWFPALLVAIFLLFTSTAQAKEWWNDDWQYRRQIDLDTTAQGADIQEQLSDIPVLVRLHAGNFNFANAKADGSDLRFMAEDNETQLKHQIDSFDAVDEVALIWVKAPRVAASGQSKIFLYYGNKNAADGQDALGTFANKYGMVLHLGEAEGPPRDSTANKNNAASFAGGQAQPSVIGNGMAFYGGVDKMVIPASPSLNMADGFTFSGWLRVNQQQKDGYLFFRGDGSNSIVIGVADTSLYAQVADGATTVRTPATATLTPATWHHIAVSVQPGKHLTVYIDGREMAASPMPGLLPALNGDIILGASAADTNHFAGDIDEIRLSTVTRSAAWIKGIFSSQGLQTKLVGYGAEMAGGGGGGSATVTYLKIVAGNISLDGWLVIGVLMIMGMMSMMVLVLKTFHVHLYAKDNKAFLESFRKHSGLFCLDGHYEEFENSPLHRVYRTGCETLTRMFSSSEKESSSPSLNSKEMSGFKAALERGYIQETKGFNDRMVVVILAISGGPFLGLLGTVWGVMNTFAAMAATGEANIMAIAPGVASALATTVAGLLVAIPSLFGYNYLVGKLKALTADIGIFIDEFIILVDVQHGEEP